MLFDFCNTRLVHGWLVDPQDAEMYNFICTLSYNQLVEKQIQLQSLVQQTEELSKKMDALKINAAEGESADAAPPPETGVKEEEAAKITKEGNSLF